MEVPALCRECEYAFASGIRVENAINITFKDNTAAPCPNCGGIGDVIEGVFNFYESAFEVISIPQVTKQELAKLRWIMIKYNVNNYSREIIAEEIESEVPKFNNLIDLLPQTREEKRGDIKFTIKTILFIIGLLFSASQTNVNIDINLNFYELIEIFYQENNKDF